MLLDVAAASSGEPVGTTYGLAYARRTRLVYAAAFSSGMQALARKARMRYTSSLAGTGSVVSFFTVPGTVTNAHDTSDYNRDNGDTGWNGVGTTSLGGLALSEDESTLYVMNLANRTLYALNATTGAMINSQAAPTNLPVPSGTCAAADARPFALTMYRGTLYAGFVCSAASTANVDSFTDSNSNGIWDMGDYYVDTNNNGVRDVGESYYELTGNSSYTAPEPFTDGDGNGIYNLGDTRNLRAYVYTVNPSTLAFGASPVLDVPSTTSGLSTHTQGRSVTGFRGQASIATRFPVYERSIRSRC